MSRGSRGILLGATAVLAAALLTACGGQEEAEPKGPPTDRERLAGFTGLKAPENAKDLTVATAETDDERTRMKAAFGTDRKGAERFCRAANLGTYPDPEGPGEEEQEAFGVGGRSVGGSVSCRGVDPKSGDVQRDVLVVYPTKDTAEVHLIAYEVD
ncbi:hypothetical protein CLV63_11358 [Murinocardiopsis flavida]|uniref:Subtilisin inhibitor-like n=1 Tax=Murinocardiopsis flavida TaxID=645275 RepID=A0A2P8DFA1_9ACTN|nr:hypothetical protein [Murinocardiopsis flavida]PSK95895.1 hypothetical protein CLV63_11358 [Murinocardiopsis flavida]